MKGHPHMIQLSPRYQTGHHPPLISATPEPRPAPRHARPAPRWQRSARSVTIILIPYFLLAAVAGAHFQWFLGNR